MKAVGGVLGSAASAVSRFGLVGVGHMGQGIARNVLAKKSKRMSFSVYDVSPANVSSLSGGDIHIAESLEDLTSRSDVIALSLPSKEAQDRVLFGPEGIMQAVVKQDRFEPLIVVDHGTFPHSFVLDCHSTLSRQGISYVDAPVSGGPAGAASGSLSVMIGCTMPELSKLTPVLQLYASNISRFGATGSGMAAKLVNQLLVGVHAQAAAEAIALAERMKLDMSILSEMLVLSWGHSRVQQLVMNDYIRIQKSPQGWALMDGPTGAPLRNLDKDFGCVLEALAGAGADSGLTLPTTRATAEAISHACAAGRQDGPFATLLENLRARPPPNST